MLFFTKKQTLLIRIYAEFVGIKNKKTVKVLTGAFGLFGRRYGRCL